MYLPFHLSILVVDMAISEKKKKNPERRNSNNRTRIRVI